ncbi:hypothetical protein [Georgenia sp. SYP-B2076]|uniref:hypothetical protein n=1 Tax=Georgenia sp. SYP-B2076 TaxID=2495881 RepID=UPI000F8E83FD|nr:hypothetical protein [Georgenia sp. SYP-B2076]
MTAESWTRTDGVMVAAAIDPAAVAEHLSAARVVARLEWYPATSHFLSVAVLADADGHVAVTRGDDVVPGPTLATMAADLDRAFDADVLVDGVPPEDRRGAHRAPGDTAGGDGAAVGTEPATADPLPTVTDDIHDARTVVLTPMHAHQAPLHATLLERAVTVLEHPVGEETRRLLVTAGPGRDLGVLGWDADAYPVLRLQVDEDDRSALLLPAPEDSETDEVEGAVVHSWAMRSRFVYGAAGPSAGSPPVGPRTGIASGDAMRELTHRLLGDADDVAAFVAAVPGADPDAVAAALAMTGPSGLAAFVAALGLPAEVTDILEGHITPDELPGSVTHPAQRLGRAAASSARLALEQHGPAMPVLEGPTSRWVARGALAGLGAVAAGIAVAALVRRGRR